MKFGMIAVAIFVSCMGSAHAAVQGKEIEYSSEGTVMKGYLAYDDSIKGKRPGVLVIHEWWGHNEYARKRARMLAGLGYTAFALDMYGDGKQAAHPDDAGKFSGELRKNMGVATSRFIAAMSLLQDQPTVDSRHIAAIGYCFGGGIALEMARTGLPLDGVASFHGSLTAGAPARPGETRAKILVLTGEADPFVPQSQVEAFRQEMDHAQADYKIVSYPGAKHSFTNPEADKYGREFNLPLAYDAKADEESWKELQAFLQRVFH